MTEGSHDNPQQALCDQLDALLAENHALTTYRDAWHALDGVMVDAGMSAKAQPADAVARLRERLAERQRLRADLAAAQQDRDANLRYLTERTRERDELTCELETLRRAKGGEE